MLNLFNKRIILYFVLAFSLAGVRADNTINKVTGISLAVVNDFDNIRVASEKLLSKLPVANNKTDVNYTFFLEYNYFLARRVASISRTLMDAKNIDVLEVKLMDMMLRDLSSFGASILEISKNSNFLLFFKRAGVYKEFEIIINQYNSLKNKLEPMSLVYLEHKGMIKGRYRIEAKNIEVGYLSRDIEKLNRELKLYLTNLEEMSCIVNEVSKDLNEYVSRFLIIVKNRNKLLLNLKELGNKDESEILKIIYQFGNDGYEEITIRGRLLNILKISNLCKDEERTKILKVITKSYLMTQYLVFKLLQLYKNNVSDKGE